MTQVISWDGHDINDGDNYSATLSQSYSQPPVSPAMVERDAAWPILGRVGRPAFTLPILEITIIGSDVDALRSQLQGWFDADDETPKRLVIADDDGGRERYVEAIAGAVQQAGGSAGLLFGITLVQHGDARKRSTSLSSTPWTVTASGQTKVIANNGEADAYPIIAVTPQAIKGDDYAYKRFISVRPQSERGSWTPYAIDITNNSLDHAALVAAGKSLASGDDVRVMVDGVEVDRWLDGVNTSTLKVWINLVLVGSFPPSLRVAIDDTTEITEITVGTDGGINHFGGTIQIDDEIFSYTSARKQDGGPFLGDVVVLEGVKRAQHGTTKAAHTTGTAVETIQHDIWLLYGRPSAEAPDTDDNYKPAFNLSTSTNTSWDYDEFGENDGLRSASWKFSREAGNVEKHTDNHGLQNNPWLELGINSIGYAPGMIHRARWEVFNQYGITNANFQNGEKLKVNLDAWNCQIQSNDMAGLWNQEYAIPAPSADGAWEAWSRNEALNADSARLSLYFEVDSNSFTDPSYLEVADVTLTLDSSKTPQIAICAEQGNYLLAATITNVTTGQVVLLDFVLGLGETLEMDSDRKTVTREADSSPQLQALTLVGGARRDWLKLVPGNNTLKYEEAGVADVDLTIEFEERYF